MSTDKITAIEALSANIVETKFKHLDQSTVEEAKKTHRRRAWLFDRRGKCPR